MPSSVLKAIADRAKSIAQLERELDASTSGPTKVDVGDLTQWVEEQLADLASLLKEDVPRVKAEFGRLNLALNFNRVEAEPRAQYVVEGQCDLSALVFSFVRSATTGQKSAGGLWRAAGRQSAVLDSSRGVRLSTKSGPPVMPKFGPPWLTDVLFREV